MIRTADAIGRVPTRSITPSPENDRVYGEMDLDNPEFYSLYQSVCDSGVLEAITISADGFILSGHRRHAAATMAGLAKVPIRIMDVRRAECTEIEWKQLIIQFNRQRVKPAAVRMREAMLSIDPTLAHEQLISAREERDRGAPEELYVGRGAGRSKITKAKLPMLQAAISAIDELANYWPLTVRQIHYRLLNDPPLVHGSKTRRYENDSKCYKSLCNLLARARIEGYIKWEAITDETRPVSNLRFSQDVGQFVAQECEWFLQGYRRDLMQSQLDHIEIVAEKMTVQSILAPIASKYCIPMTVGRGYCSLHPRKQMAERFLKSGKDRLVLLFVSDLDPDGDCIATSFAKYMREDFQIEPKCIKALLTMEQAMEWGLQSSSQRAKKTSSRYETYVTRYGTDLVYELEAVEPERMQRTVAAVIESVFCAENFNAELDHEQEDSTMLAATRKLVVEFMESLDI